MRESHISSPTIVPLPTLNTSFLSINLVHDSPFFQLPHVLVKLQLLDGVFPLPPLLPGCPGMLVYIAYVAHIIAAYGHQGYKEGRLFDCKVAISIYSEILSHQVPGFINS